MTQQSSNLDLLRATAVTSVFLCHLIRALGLKEHPVVQLWGLDNLGFLGVMMFFIHTSLVLMMSLERLSTTRGNTSAMFYLRRLFRIYPLSIVTVIAVVVLRIPPYFDMPVVWPGIGTLISNLLLVQNVTGAPSVTGPLWSLPFEVQMYLLLPFLYIAARRIRSYRGALLLIGCAFIVWWLDSHLARALKYPALLAYAPWFAMGIACYGLSRNITPSKSSKWYVVSLSAFVLLPLVVHTISQDYRAGWLTWGFGLLFALTLPLFNDITSKVLRTVAHTIATYSYGIYLWHVPILWFAFQKLHLLPRIAQIAICIVLLSVIPVLLYHLLEAPMIRLGATLARRTAARPVPAHKTASVGA